MDFRFVPLHHTFRETRGRSALRVRSVTLGVFALLVLLTAGCRVGRREAVRRDDGALETALEWSRLAPLPPSAAELEIETEGSAFTRAFRVSFRAPEAEIEAWATESPGLQESAPDVDDGTRTYVIAPGGGAAYAEVTLTTLEDGMALVEIYTYWS
ncbi:MAG: hypothetical protein ACLFU8_15195 [Anaerolineales bacterium]